VPPVKHFNTFLATLFAQGPVVMMAVASCVISRHRNCQNRYGTSKGSGGGARNEAVGPKNEWFLFYSLAFSLFFLLFSIPFRRLALNSSLFSLFSPLPASRTKRAWLLTLLLYQNKRRRRAEKSI
jgi:hypothetical protein